VSDLKLWATARALPAAFGLTACSLVVPDAAAQSLVRLRVAGYQKTGPWDDFGPGSTYSTGSYIGPAVGDQKVAGIVTGPGVKVTLIPPGSPDRQASAFYGTTWIGEGPAQRGCGMQIDRFMSTKTLSLVKHHPGAARRCVPVSSACS